MPDRSDGVRSRRPLQNRVDPSGALHAVAERGRMMGNRGGRFHADDQTLGRRRWASRQWIACVCAFKQRKRQVWGHGYTEPDRAGLRRAALAVYESDRRVAC